MAAAKANKAITVDLPECPVCLETLTAPIYQCQMGHSLCSSCTNTLKPPVCPICRQPMTKMRNWLSKLYTQYYGRLEIATEDTDSGDIWWTEAETWKLEIDFGNRN